MRHLAGLSLVCKCLSAHHDQRLTQYNSIILKFGCIELLGFFSAIDSRTIELQQKYLTLVTRGPNRSFPWISPKVMQASSQNIRNLFTRQFKNFIFRASGKWATNAVRPQSDVMFCNFRQKGFFSKRFEEQPATSTFSKVHTNCIDVRMLTPNQGI